MKKFVYLFSLMALALTFNANAQDTKAADPNAPKIEFETLVVDYGTIENGSDPFRTVTFKNTGKSPLVITNCKGSCGCTVPTCPKDPIMPGQTGTLKVKYDTKRTGAISKTVTVKSNASNSVVYLQVKGTIKAAPKKATFPTNNNGPVNKP